MATTDILIELEIKKWEDETTGKFMLYVKVIRHQNIQAELFVFRRDYLTNEDKFSNVVSVANMTSFPKYNPTTGSPFFLDHNLTLEFDSAQQREDTLGFLLIDVRKTKDDWEVVKGIVNNEYTVII